jgi:hypothetical protein
MKTLPCKICDKPVKMKKQADHAMCLDCRRYVGYRKQKAFEYCFPRVEMPDVPFELMRILKKE